MVYCKHDVNHQSIAYHSEDDDNYGWDCNSDLNVARDLECPTVRHVRKHGIS